MGWSATGAESATVFALGEGWGDQHGKGLFQEAPENLRNICGGEPPSDVMPIRTFGFTQLGCCFAAVGSVAEARRLHRLQAKQPEGPVSW